MPGFPIIKRFSPLNSNATLLHRRVFTVCSRDRLSQAVLERPQITVAREGRMEQRLSVVTLGVADLDKARHFYEALGWR